MDRTADGVEVREGLVCYDNNLDVVVVGKPLPYGNPAEPTWYSTTYYEGGGKGPSQDASRLSTTFRDYNGKRWVAPQVVGLP